MAHDWMLVETLGGEPAVVAEGAHTRDLVPIGSVLRRNPHLMAIQTAISETVRGGGGLSSITPKSDCVIRTEVVQMSDGRIHGVQIWVGSAGDDPPPRPLVGSLIWDLTSGTATDTAEALQIGGWDPARQVTHGRVFADDLPRRNLNPSEAKVLALVVKPQVGVTICNTWDVADYRGEQITVGFVARSLPEEQPDGSQRLICRAMNWRSVREGPSIQHDLLGERILSGLTEPGVHRALVDPVHWTLLKWLDDPVPFFDWRAGMGAKRAIHPGDEAVMSAMAADFATGSACGMLRMLAHGGGWTPVHVTVHCVDLDDDVHAALAALRVPTAAELQAAGYASDEPARPRKRRLRRDP